jgi:tetratricopeptide (TPR) repeat protein
MFERYLRDFEASYLLTVNVWDSVETFQYQMPESRRLWFSPSFSVAGTRIYEIRSSILDPPRVRAISAPDTTTARGLLIAGRNAMLEQRYHDALGFFGRCLQKNPSQPEVAFQLVSALSFLGDSVGAMNMVEQLFTLPKSTAYSQSVQSTLAIMEQILKAKRFPNPSTRSFAIFEAGLACWGLGYREAARSVMREVVRLDSMNFVGALWGIHIARELGDTLESNRFLYRLKRIDRNAQIVGDWEEIRRLGESLRKHGDRKPAEIHLALARVYAKIELFDEAIDATLRALKLESANVDAWLYKGEVMEKKKAPYGAAVSYRQVLRLEPHNSFAQSKLDSLSQ